MVATAERPHGVTTGSQIAAPQDRTNKITAFVPFGCKDEIKLSVKIVQDLIAVPTASGKKCSDKDALKFIMLCKSKGLNPFEGDAFLIGYDGKDGPQFSLITAHQAFLKRAEVHPEYDGMESGVTVKTVSGDTIDRDGDLFFDDDTLIGGWATVYFKNRSKPMRKRLKLSTFNTGRSRWAKDPAGMIVKCAEADALRSSFPTLLGSLIVDQGGVDASKVRMLDSGDVQISDVAEAETIPAEDVSQELPGTQQDDAERTAADQLALEYEQQIADATTAKALDGIRDLVESPAAREQLGRERQVKLLELISERRRAAR